MSYSVPTATFFGLITLFFKFNLSLSITKTEKQKRYFMTRLHTLGHCKILRGQLLISDI